MNRSARYVRRGRDSWFKRLMSQKPLPAWLVIATDIFLIGIGLVVFAVFHHVLPRSEVSTGIVSERVMVQNVAEDANATDEASTPPEDALSESDGSADPAEDTPAQAEGADPAEGSPAQAEDSAAQEVSVVPAETAAPEVEAVEEKHVQVGYFGDRFPDKFTNGKVVKTSNSYQSSSVNITLRQADFEGSTFYYADIYIKDIECFRTAFAKGTFGRGLKERPPVINKREGGILAINGDYYGARSNGVVIRNGELYRNKRVSQDVCVLYWDGTMEIYGRTKFNAKKEMENGAYQAWHFGPNLLDKNGKPLRTFSDGSLGPNNPRTVLGYYEPGHYCFVAVDGRSSGSSGLTIKVLAQLMSKLGCKRAFNLDGGNSSFMVIGDKVVNNPSGGGRASSDIIMIVDK